MGKCADIGFLEDVLGFAVVAHDAARDPIELAVMGLHDGAKRAGVAGGRPPREVDVGRRQGQPRPNFLVLGP